jgi:hypothetical protein
MGRVAKWVTVYRFVAPSGVPAIFVDITFTSVAVRPFSISGESGSGPLISLGITFSRSGVTLNPRIATNPSPSDYPTYLLNTSRDGGGSIVDGYYGSLVSNWEFVPDWPNFTMEWATSDQLLLGVAVNGAILPSSDLREFNSASSWVLELVFDRVLIGSFSEQATAGALPTFTLSMALTKYSINQNSGP